MLTKKQHQLLLFIDGYLKENGISPSFDEMKDALSLRSKSGVHRLISALNERGFLRRLPHRARALEVVRLPDNVIAVPRRERRAGTAEPPGERPSRGDGEVTELARVRQRQPFTIPLYGRIAAGSPMEAIANRSGFVEVPPFLVGGGEHFALEVEGDSMVDAGIHSGDTVVIQRCETAENGAIVVALVDGQEVTLKRLRQRGQSIALEPANSSYETKIFGPDRVKVQGRLVGLIRRYD